MSMGFNPSLFIYYFSSLVTQCLSASTHIKGIHLFQISTQLFRKWHILENLYISYQLDIPVDIIPIYVKKKKKKKKSSLLK